MGIWQHHNCSCLSDGASVEFYLMYFPVVNTKNVLLTPLFKSFMAIDGISLGIINCTGCLWQQWCPNVWLCRGWISHRTGIHSPLWFWSTLKDFSSQNLLSWMISYKCSFTVVTVYSKSWPVKFRMVLSIFSLTVLLRKREALVFVGMSVNVLKFWCGDNWLSSEGGSNQESVRVCISTATCWKRPWYFPHLVYDLSFL